jgi:hypothetical protein
VADVVRREILVSAAPPSASPGATSLADPATEGARRPPSRTRRYVGVAVAVAVAVVLVVVVVGPLLTGSGSGGGAALLTYSGARPIADHAVSGFEGGGWTLLFAAGLDSATAVEATLNTSALGNISCFLTPVTATGALTLPAYPGNRSLGVAPAWEFGYRNSADLIALVSVVNGLGEVLATLSGLQCALFAQLITPIPGSVLDSSQAAAAVHSSAAAFLVAHPNASAVFGLVGGFAIGGRNPGPEWSIQYSTCALGKSAVGTGVAFNATVNATSGQVVNTSTTSGVTCSSGTLVSGLHGPRALLASPAASLLPTRTLSRGP